MRSALILLALLAFLLPAAGLNRRRAAERKANRNAH